MSTGKHYWEFTIEETPLHKWFTTVGDTLYTSDGLAVKSGDVVRVDIDTSKMTIVWNPDPPNGETK